MNIHRTATAWLAAGFGACVLVACGGGGGGDYNMGNSSTGSTGNGMSYAATNLVSDASGTSFTDPNLVNAWGIAFNPQGFVWVADNATSTSTLYDGHGVPQSLVVSIPSGQAGSRRASYSTERPTSLSARAASVAQARSCSSVRLALCPDGRPM
jgi:hypothetical protein